MQLLIEISTLIFVLGTAAVFGGFFHQRTEKSKNITNGMYLGSLVGLGGYLLALLLAKIDGAKSVATNTWVVLVILVVLAVMAYMNRNDRKSKPGVWLLAGILSAAALALSFIWHIS